MDNVYSHHVIVMEGDHRYAVKTIAKIMGLQLEEL